ncbi:MULTISPECIES: hypothetical protein [Proteus]|jgi:hypothetical protein|uniref:Uncharacterized protein n=2 Tax=Proteus TaxID=583 RepID=A0ABU6E9G2_9GAMM|nr:MULTISPECIES: hypothetical protein [Proteus]DAZ13561.1 MAG TPA: hypothetical protein [Caudoviricetes sp.]AUU38605.1 hypothetical protein MC73_006390 [Proteus mirabilis]EKW4365125.1 hypothetical protein [Proteus mirabilis]ELB1205470.1 hypothetical protein [Proteus mirabilis]ELZ9636729.1 hypothetical protein [Proteus mirabilis]
MQQDYNDQVETFSTIVSELFLIRQVAMHKRPVFRSSLGDIRFSVETLANFLKGYYREDDKSDIELSMLFFNMLKREYLPDPKVFISWCINDELTDEAVNKISELLENLAQMEFSEQKTK